MERALEVARNELFEAQDRTSSGNGSEPAAAVSWADAFLAMAEKSLGAAAVARPHRDRPLVLLHLRAGGGGHLHLGPGLDKGLRHYLSCDARVRTVVESEGKATSVGRAFRIVPDRTRMVVEDRDGGCRVPGCTARRWLHVHHIVHWTDGGPTDTPNLLALCSAHHRMHHRGRLGISGDADEADGVIFTDERGRRMAGCGRPAPPSPGQPLPTGNWVAPAGEPLEPWAIYFNEPTAASAGASSG